MGSSLWASSWCRTFRRIPPRGIERYGALIVRWLPATGAPTGSGAPSGGTGAPQTGPKQRSPRPAREDDRVEIRQRPARWGDPWERLIAMCVRNKDQRPGGFTADMAGGLPPLPCRSARTRRSYGHPGPRSGGGRSSRGETIGAGWPRGDRQHCSPTPMAASDRRVKRIHTLKRPSINPGDARSGGRPHGALP